MSTLNFIWKGILVSFVLLFVTAIPNYGQLSPQLYDALPPALKPKDPQQLRCEEVSGLFRHFADQGMMHPSFDTLCLHFLPRYTTIKSKKARTTFLKNLVDYLNTRNTLTEGAFNPALVIYNNILLDEIKNDPAELLLIGPTAYNLRAFMQLKADDHLKAYESIRNGIDLARASDNLYELARSYTIMGYVYNSLALYDKVIACADSALACFSGVTQIYAKEGRASILLTKANGYLNQIFESPQQQFMDSVSVLLRQADPSALTGQALKTKWFVIAQALKYFEQDYTAVVRYADSANFYNKINTRVRDAVNSFKGLSLLHTGQQEAALKIFNTIDYSSDAWQTALAGVFLKELAHYYKQSGNYPRATDYYEQLVTFNNKRTDLKLQGELFELEQKYNLVERDAEISKLKNEKLLNAWIAGTVLLLIGITSLLLYQKNRNYKKERDQLVLQIEEQTTLQIQRIEQNALKIKEEERKKFSQGLHDDFAASLAASLHLIRVNAEDETDPVKKSQLRHIAGEIEGSYKRARSISHGAFYSGLDENFTQTLSDHVSFAFSGSRIKANIFIDKIPSGLLPETKTTLFLILKEAITNIIKHARAGTADILIFEEEGMIIMEIKDNGRGIPAGNRGDSLGLISIRERINSLEGSFDIVSEAGSGTFLSIKIPLQWSTLPA